MKVMMLKNLFMMVSMIALMAIACTAPKFFTTELGVKYQDLVVGEGAECALGTKLVCHYTLWFADSLGNKETRFQSSKDSTANGPGQPFTCTLGQRLIKGWSDGMVGMKEGGTRLLIVKPELGYGAGDRGIPPNQTLVFEIDFLEIAK